MTDHKPLTYALRSLTSDDRAHTAHELRQMSYISEYTTDIRHIKGVENAIADALSRSPLSALGFAPLWRIDFGGLAAAQRGDTELSHLQTTPTALKLEWLPHAGAEETVCCNVSTGSARPFVPSRLRREVFTSMHTLSHPGIRATQKLVTERFIWPGINRDVRQWTRECVSCQRAKVQRHIVTPLASFPTPDARFDHIHVDIVGPPPPCESHSYLLNMVDRFTRWAEAVPILDTTTETVARNILQHWLFQFGVPSTITADRGSEFESALFAHFAHLVGTTRIRTTAYNPTSNGMVERFHRQLKAALMNEGRSCVEALPLVLLSIRTTLKADIGCSADELVYGTTFHLPGQFFVPSQSQAQIATGDYAPRLRNIMKELRATPPRQPAA